MPTFFSLTDEPLATCIRVGTIPGRPGYIIQVNDKRYDTSVDLKRKVEATPGFKEMTPEQKSALVLNAYMSSER